jgi:lethal(2) giant larvae protein
LFLAADMSGNHSIIICSEEQFKVLSLPQLRIKHKEKLTATDGSKVRKLGVITLNNKQGELVNFFKYNIISKP